MNEVLGKVAVITGGASGIGAATAVVLAEEGARGIVIADWNDAGGNHTVQYIQDHTNCKAVFIKTDVSKQKDIDRLFSITLQEFQTVDILVNCAGICCVTPLTESTYEDWYNQIEINLTGSYHSAMAALRIMMPKRYGKIINVSSVSGRIGGIRTSPGYVASKGGIISLTKTLAKFAAPYNINVNAVAPGVIATEMTKNHSFHPEEIPMGRRGTAREVANVILFLASDRSSYVVGTTIDVNGGSYMN